MELKGGMNHDIPRAGGGTSHTGLIGSDDMMKHTDEAWLYTLADMESFVDSDDELSRLIRETVKDNGDQELDDDELQGVVAARKVPPLRSKPEAP